MTKKIIVPALVVASLLSQSAYAALEAYSDNDLRQVDGQAGIYNASTASISLGLDFRLNMDKTTAGVYSNVCANGEVACNIGISFNNRFTATNRKDWLVLKNVTGSINVPDILISGQDVNISNSATQILKPALTLTLGNQNATRSYAANPNNVLIKQLGFESLAVETDSAAEVDAAGNLNLSNLAGYRVATLSAATALKSDGNAGTETNTFDAGKFTGFMGLDITANIAVNGNIKIFSCTRTSAGCS